jgi:Icc-related predicted phosphoesterase
MKILCISDTHNLHHQIPSRFWLNEHNDVDMCIHAGDFTYSGLKRECINFLSWYNDLNFKHKILIAGNHDFLFEYLDNNNEIDSFLSDYPSITYLKDSGVTINGFNIWGSPYSPKVGNWAFGKDKESMIKHWELIPLNTNILITHGPAKGFLDTNNFGKSLGCENLRFKLGELKELKLHVFGHIHESYGYLGLQNGEKFINASSLDYKYSYRNKPIIIEI